MSVRNEQCKKVCKILDDALANRPQERDALIVAVQTAFNALADGRWILVEERLPEESGLYLVTSTDIIDDYAVDTRFFNREKPFVGWSGYEWHEDPLAWMELPKPYIPEENEL